MRRFPPATGRRRRFPGSRRRQGNRLRYLAEALSPITDQLSRDRLERLVMALALCVGIESIVVLEDICGQTPEEAEEVKLWMAEALLRASLQEDAQERV